MKERIKYLLFSGFTFLLISSALLLLARQYLLQRNTVHVTFYYKAFCKEDISLYWNGGKGFSDQDHQTQTTGIRNPSYDFKINGPDSLTEIRLDPDSKFKVALLDSIRIEGLSKPVRFTHFSGLISNGLIVKEKQSVCYLQRISGNNDPFLLLKIPTGSKSVNKAFTRRDWCVMLLCILFACILTFFIREKIRDLTHTTSFVQATFISAFLLLIFSYWTNLVLKYYESPSSIENRVMAHKPSIDSLAYTGKKYFSDYTAWFNDHYAFKQLFVFANSFFKIKLFHTSPMPTNMYIGKEFQFFSANELLRDDILGKRRLSREELNSMYANNLFKHDYLSRQKISYYLTIPPSKQTVYENLLPDYLLLQLRGKKMAQQFITELTKNKSDFYIDLIDLLKQRHLLYPPENIFYRYDLHWSDWGAFLAYRQLINTIQKEHNWVGKALEFNEIDIDTCYEENADLAKLILMQNTFKKERYLIKAHTPDLITETVVNGVYRYPIYKYKNPAAKGKLLVFRDSYSEQWKWLIARHFNESVFIWDQNISQQLINEYKPDIVIQENCEMFLFYLFNPLRTHD